MTPTGNKKQAAGVGIPVINPTTALPPDNNIDVTKMFVSKAKHMKTA